MGQLAQGPCKSDPPEQNDGTDLTRNQKQVRETLEQYDLLLCLLRQAGRVVPREQILREVWGENHFGDENLLGVYIRYLRRKLEPDPDKPQVIRTLRGVGYMFVPPKD